MQAIARRTLFVAAGVAVAAAVGFALYSRLELRDARSRFARHLGEPDLSMLAGASLPTEENAATWITRGLVAFDLGAEPRDTARRLAALPPADWTTASSAAAQGLLARQGAGLELLQQAANCPGGSFEIDYALGSSAPLPDYLALLAASRVVVVDARLALARQETARIVTSLDTLAAILDTLATDSLLVSTLVAYALDTHYLALVRDILASGVDDPAVLDSVERHLARHDPRQALRRGLRGEASLLLAPRGSEWLETDPGPVLRGLETLLRSPLESLAQANLLDAYSALSEDLELDWPRIQARLAARAAERPSWNYSAQLMVNLEHAALRLKGLESSYGLARLTLGYVRDDRAAQPGIDPLTGRSVSVAALADAGRSFNVPGAEEIWSELARGEARAAVPPPFDWPVTRRSRLASP